LVDKERHRICILRYVKEGEVGVRRIILLLATMVTAVLLANGVALALPTDMPDNTLMVDGRVRAIEQVGTNLWVGGKFTRVQSRNGTVVANVSNVAVFDLVTEEYVNIAPRLSGTGSEVWDMAPYGDTGNLLIAGQFAGPTNTQKNLVVVDGSTGGVIRWYNSPALRSTLAAPDLGRIYGGGVSLSAFDFATGNKLWSQAKTTVDTTLHSSTLVAGYRDLELDADGRTIWAACGCDAVAGPDGVPNPAKALVKLDTEGHHDADWVTEAVADAYGISVAQAGGDLYLGAGGFDFLAGYPKEGNGSLAWLRDSSGSTQVVEIMDGQLVVGGHFWEVADEPDDSCGHRPSSNDAVTTLDLNDECQTRHGLAAYSFDGVLDPNWSPMLEGKYSLAWALHPQATPQGSRLHVGGEFTEVSGIPQTYYTRLSNAQAPPPSPCTVTGTSSSETLTGASGDDVVCAGGGNDILKGLEGNDILKGEGGADKLYGGIGDDTLDGGAATDTVDFSGSSAAVSASLTTGSATGEGSDTLVGIEKLTGSKANDTLSGSEANDALNGGSGADSLVGLSGVDILTGGGGNDTLDSGDGVAGNDTLDGASGTDSCITDTTEKSILSCER
jgi:Ca2+-binding RTX toxin-like protein